MSWMFWMFRMFRMHIWVLLHKMYRARHATKLANSFCVATLRHPPLSIHSKITPTML